MTAVPPPVLSLPQLFSPVEAAGLLQGLGLVGMTEGALRTRAYRRQVPFHLNGRRIMFTAGDLREIVESQPQPASGAAADVLLQAPGKRPGGRRGRRPCAGRSRGRSRAVRAGPATSGGSGASGTGPDSVMTPEEARAEATTQITGQLEGSRRDRLGRRMLVEDWISIWVGLLGDIEPTTRAKYRYFIVGHILPAFGGRQLGSLTFEEIEGWDQAIPTRISARGRPYARSVATSARSVLITILGDAVHAGKLERNPAVRRKGRRGRMRARGRAPSAAAQRGAVNVITPFQALCLAERCALLSGRDTDFVMNIFAAWTGVRWGELLAVEGWAGPGSPLQIPPSGIATYAVDWQLRELGGVVGKSAPKDGSYRVLDLPPFLAALMAWAMANRQETCSCPHTSNRPACKAEDPAPAGYLFLGTKGGHPRRSNYAGAILTPAAEGLHPARHGTRRPVYVTAGPWPGVPVRRGNRRHKAADLSGGTWPGLVGRFTPHGYRHAHATWPVNPRG